MRIIYPTVEEELAYRQGPVEDSRARKGGSKELIERGNMAEAIACAWLRERGYDVFPNMRNRGPVDVVAIKGDRIRKIDVKLVKPIPYLSRSSTLTIGAMPKPLTKKQKEMGVERLLVAEDGFCAFSRRVMIDHFRNALGLPATERRRGRKPKLDLPLST